MNVNLYGLFQGLMRFNTRKSRDDIAAEMVEIAKKLRGGKLSAEMAADVLELMSALVLGRLSPGKAGS